METETKHRLEEKAIERAKYLLEEPLEHGGIVGATANGHLQDPPVYPAYDPDKKPIVEETDLGVYVHFLQKDSEDTEWHRHGDLILYSQLS